MTMTAKDLRDAVAAGTMSRDEAVIIFAGQGSGNKAKAAHALFGAGQSSPATPISRAIVAQRKARRNMLDAVAELRDEDVRPLSTDADLAR